jgi:hypothetical protein
MILRTTVAEMSIKRPDSGKHNDWLAVKVFNGQSVFHCNGVLLETFKARLIDLLAIFR